MSTRAVPFDTGVFTARLASNVTANAASTTHPHASPPSQYPSAVSSAPATATTASRGAR